MKVLFFYISIISLSLMQNLIAQEPPALSTVQEALPVISPVAEKSQDQQNLESLVMGKIIEKLIKGPPPVGIDFLSIFENIQNKIINKEFGLTTCNAILTEAQKQLRLDPKQVDYNYLKRNGSEVLFAALETRVLLQKQLKDMSIDCKHKFKVLLTEMRMAEDYIGLIYYNIRPIGEKLLEERDKFIPILDTKNFNTYKKPFSITPQETELRTGDVFLTKGKTMAGSMVSQITTPGHTFSHLAIVYVEPTTKEVKIIQAMGDRMARIYTYKEFLLHDNMRIVLYRANDPNIAYGAGTYIYKKILENTKKNIDVPYDFSANYDDPSKLDCAEVIYTAYQNSDGGEIDLPEVPSEISIKSQTLKKRFMVKNGTRMVPADMEADSRFHLVWDWTDYRRVREAWFRDALASEIYRWADEYGLSFTDTWRSYQIQAVWGVRNIPYVWDLVVNFAPKLGTISKQTPPVMLASVILMFPVEKMLVKELRRIDWENYNKTSKWLSYSELKTFLNNYREKNPNFINLFFEAVKD